MAETFYGNAMIFPDSWAYGPPDPPEPACETCGDTGYAENSYEPCPDCSPTEGTQE